MDQQPDLPISVWVAPYWDDETAKLLETFMAAKTYDIKISAMYWLQDQDVGKFLKWCFEAMNHPHSLMFTLQMNWALELEWIRQTSRPVTAELKKLEINRKFARDIEELLSDIHKNIVVSHKELKFLTNKTDLQRILQGHILQPDTYPHVLGALMYEITLLSNLMKKESIGLIGIWQKFQKQLITAVEDIYQARQGHFLVYLFIQEEIEEMFNNGIENQISVESSFRDFLVPHYTEVKKCYTRIKEILIRQLLHKDVLCELSTLGRAFD
jgi:hypothetical protein